MIGVFGIIEAFYSTSSCGFNRGDGSSLVEYASEKLRRTAVHQA